MNDPKNHGRVNPPPFYVPPTDSSIRERLVKQSDEGAATPHVDFVRDLICASAGGEFKTTEELYQQAEYRVVNEVIPTLQRNKDGTYSTGKKSYSYETLRQRLTHEQHESDVGVSSFLKELDFDEVPGKSPLDKAMNTVDFLRKLHEAEAKRNGDDDGSAPKGQKSWNPKKFRDQKDGKNKAERMNQAIKFLKDMTPMEQDMILKSTDDPIELLVDVALNEKVLEVSQRLRKVRSFTAHKSRTLKSQVGGSKKMTTQMESPSQIGRAIPSEFVLPRHIRNNRWLSSQMTVRLPAEQESTSVWCTILVDTSGSMDCIERWSKAGGVILAKLQEVIAGNGAVEIAYFQEKIIGSFKLIRTAEEAKEYIRKFLSNIDTGGGTSIQRALMEANDHIKNRRLPPDIQVSDELVIITDGDDSINMTRWDIRNISKLHAFVVDGNNSKLVNLARSTGGTGFSEL